VCTPPASARVSTTSAPRTRAGHGTAHTQGTVNGRATRAAGLNMAADTGSGSAVVLVHNSWRRHHTGVCVCVCVVLKGGTADQRTTKRGAPRLLITRRSETSARPAALRCMPWRALARGRQEGTHAVRRHALKHGACTAPVGSVTLGPRFSTTTATSWSGLPTATKGKACA